MLLFWVWRVREFQQLAFCYRNCAGLLLCIFLWFHAALFILMGLFSTGTSREVARGGTGPSQTWFGSALCQRQGSGWNSVLGLGCVAAGRIFWYQHNYNTAAMRLNHPLCLQWSDGNEAPENLVVSCCFRGDIQLLMSIKCTEVCIYHFQLFHTMTSKLYNKMDRAK